jgi:hypothetical protein
MLGSGMKEVRSKVSDFGEGHSRVAPYVYHIRVTFSDEDGFNNFLVVCALCKLPRPRKVNVPMEDSTEYTPQNFATLKKWFSTLDFRVAFQCEALIANSRLTPSQLLSLRQPLQKVTRQHGDRPSVSAQILRYFNDRLHTRKPGMSLIRFFEQCAQTEEATRTPEPKGGLIYVHHVTFTPSSMRLEGPHISNSNRVLRGYADYQGNFIRVDFRDEEKLQFRWTVDIDGSTFVEGRVGDILRGGFNLCGRHFDILGYSVSALREHAVWFLQRFTTSDGLEVDADTIRTQLGNFHYKKVISCPALYGARMAQAFTATDATVTVARDEWEMIPDIMRGQWCHTDGVGTISPDLALRIWSKLCGLWGIPDPSQNVPCVVSSMLQRCEPLVNAVLVPSSHRWMQGHCCCEPF